MNHKILVMLPRRLGDVVMCTPAFKQLKAHCPSLIVDALAFSKISATAIKHDPLFKTIFLAEQHPLASLHHHYDQVYSLYDSRTIYDYIGNYPVTYNRMREHHGKTLHNADMACVFLAKQFAYQPEAVQQYYIYPQQQDKDRLNTLLAATDIKPDNKLIGFHLGCSRSAKYATRNRAWLLRYFRKYLKGIKSWPLNRYLKLANNLRQDDPKVKIILTGGADEIKLGEMFSKHYPDAINLIGKTSIQVLFELLQRLNLYVAADTGTLHVACATNTPFITFFRSGKNNCVPPAADYRVVIKKEKITDISVAEVYHHARRFLK
ncbi:MAG: glycosyltransferase family 9 protein [Pseudomonadota bacterium]